MVSNSEVHGGKVGPSYLVDGFTVTMWVKFLDKVNKGTLFNYGNPTRANKSIISPPQIIKSTNVY